MRILDGFGRVIPARWTGGPVFPLLAFLLPLLSGTAAPVDASGINVLSNQGNFGAQIGYLKSSDAEEGHYLLGGHLELHMTRFFGIHGDVSYRTQEKYRFVVGDKDLELKVVTIPITFSGRLYVPLPLNLTPYGLAGAGFYRLEYRFSDDAKEVFENLEDESETDFGWHLGAGLLMTLGPRLAIFGEYRALFMDPDRALGTEIRDQIRNLDFDSSNMIAGVSLYF